MLAGPYYLLKAFVGCLSIGHMAVGIMIFLGYSLLYIVRYNICVHIVDMARSNKKPRSKYIKANNTMFYIRTGTLRKISPYIIRHTSWNDLMIARLFAAYHIGYCVCFPIFHTIGDRLGPTWVVGIAGFISGVLNCMTPASSNYDYWSLYVVRIIIGFCAGAMQPSMVQVLRYWVPPIERNYFMWAYCGITMGTCFTFFACAVIHRYSTWPTGFYSFGALQITWAVAWVLLVTDNPTKHNFISTEEATYLINTIGDIFTIKVTNAHTPWNLILKSKSFWALCCLNFGYAWMIISLCLHGTIYYSEVVGYDLCGASALTGVPFFLRLVLGVIIIHVFHWYKYNANVKRIENIRKYFIVFSHVIPGLLIMCMWFVAHIPGPILLTTAVALTAAGTDLTFDLCYELSPNFINPIHTVIKIIGNTPGIIVAYLVGHIVSHYKDSVYVWKHMWCFHATVLFTAGVVFLVWGETHVQPWNAVTRQSLLTSQPDAFGYGNLKTLKSLDAPIQFQKFLRYLMDLVIRSLPIWLPLYMTDFWIDAPRRPLKPKVSVMSNITELDEEDGSNRSSVQQRNISFFGVLKSQNNEVKLPTIK